MGDEEAAAIGGLVNGFQRQFHSAEAEAGIVAQQFVVVASDQDDAGAAVGHLEHAADHFVVGIGPEPALAQAPPVDDVADEVELLGLERAQEIDQHLGLAAAGAKVDVGNPDRAIAGLGAEALGIGQVEPLGDAAASFRGP